MKIALIGLVSALMALSSYAQSAPSDLAAHKRLESARRPVEIKINGKTFYIYIGEKEGIVEALRQVGMTPASGNDADKIADLGKDIAAAKLRKRLIVAEKPKGK
jgi:hypothetical protein